MSFFSQPKAAPLEADQPNAAGNAGAFPLTRWSMVTRATDLDEEVAGKALAELLQGYWQPLYIYALRTGLSSHDAEDGVQSFYESIIRCGSLRSAAPAGGKLRSFLLGGLHHHLQHAFRDARRQKRGGGVVVISLEQAALELPPGTDDTPDKAFDRRWACNLLDRAREKLRREYAERARGEMFALLEPALAWNGSEVSYDTIAVKMSKTRAAVEQAIKRMRVRFRKLLEEEITDTVDSPEAMEQEREHLIHILSEA